MRAWNPDGVLHFQVDDGDLLGSADPQVGHGDMAVQAGSRLEATVPLGDAESLERLRERTEQTVTRPAGSTALWMATSVP
jgi:hypothetical protein